MKEACAKERRIKRQPLLWLLGLLLAGIWSGTAAEESWGERLDLRAGVLLVASPELKGSQFSRSVVLLVDYGDHGARGLIINRPTETRLDEDFDSPVPEELMQRPLFYGGPLGPGYRLLLSARQAPDSGGLKVVDGVFFIHGGRLEASIESLAGTSVPYRIFAGYAGWAPMQLEHEVGAGTWLVVPATRHYVFGTPAEELWPRLIRYQDGLMARRRLQRAEG